MMLERRARASGAAATSGALAMALLLAATLPASGQPAPAPVYAPPVTAPVIDAFRPPDTPYGPGNRGLKYDTQPGTDVRASADGEVVFAGRVAWDRHVTVLHADGVRTSYSFLDEVHVAVGQQVGRGEVIGVAGNLLHFGARLGDSYFDPATLFTPGDVQVELLPLEIPPGATADEEAAALRALALQRGGGGLSIPGLGDVIGWLGNRARLVGHYARELSPLSHAIDVGRGVLERTLFAPPCTDDAPPARPATQRERVALLVGGLGSSSDAASIDQLQIDELGYGERDVVRFSYAGGRTPHSGASFSSLEPRPYESADTQGDLRRSAAELADAIEAVATDRPGATIDVYAHSMGGVVTRLALLQLEQRGFPLESLGLVATLAAPHDGADLATAVHAATTTVTGRAGLDVADRLLDAGLDPHSTAVEQLSETSDVVAELDRAGVPDDVELVSIAARGDMIVPAPRSRVDGARNVTVPEAGIDAHSEMVASEAATHELALALAEMPQGCVGVRDALSDAVMGHGISYIQDLGGYVMAQHL
jgi:triacylglycerol esterase/lipase EstA (alpha/beta hydrolase family)